MNEKLLYEPTILSQGNYLQLVVKLKFLDGAIIRSNDAEEVLTYKYNELGNRFVIPWRKVKGKLRRGVMEKQRGLGIEPDCHLKDDLCLRCPSCFIFGGTGETSSAKVQYNILARILGETFISTTEVGEIQPYTQNAVDELYQDTRSHDIKTGKPSGSGALMTILKVPAETEFLGVVTLRDPTLEIVSIVVNNILRMSRIGARTVEWGRIKTEILGYKLSDREDMSAYDLVGKNVDELLNIETMNLLTIEEAYKTLDIKVKKLLKEKKLIS